MRRALPITYLTLRQFLGSKAVVVAAVLALLPVAFALIYVLDDSVSLAERYLGNTVFLQLVVPTLLPLTTLILATAALGNELDDRTIHYLLLKPVGRLRIVIEKLLACLVVSTPLVLIGNALAYVVVMRGAGGEHLRLLAAMLAAAAASTLAYSAIFLLISLLVARPLLVALVYSFLWESLLGRFVPGLRYFSIRHFVSSVFVKLVDDPLLTISNPTGLTAALAVLLAASALAIILATWRLKTMSIA